MPCQIIPGFAPESVSVGGAWSVSVTTIPIDAPISWTTDIDVQLTITANGHQIKAVWQTPGEKLLTAVCEDSHASFFVIVTECKIHFLRVNPKTTFRFDQVVIEAETEPRASFENPSRRLVWSGQLGNFPEFVDNALLTSWDMPGIKEITASVCDGSDSSTTHVLVMNETMSEANKQRIKDAYDIRAKTKEEAARASVAMNDGAVTTGIGAVVAGVLTGGTVFVVVAGVASFGFWYGGNRLSELSIDPPRTDFEVVSRFEELPISFPAPDDPIEVALRAFTSDVISLAACTTHLIRSLERVDGLIMSNSNVDTIFASPFFPLQASAVAHNANLAAKLIDGVLANTEDINSSWTVVLERLDEGGLSSQSLSLNEIKDRLSDLFEAQRESLEKQLGLPPADFRNLTASVQAGIGNLIQRPPQLPSQLFDEAKTKVLGDCSGTLRNLASAFERLGV
jgi:hypothetical protein